MGINAFNTVAAEMAQCMKHLLCLSSVSGTHIKVEREPVPQSCPLTSVREPWHMCSHTIIFFNINCFRNSTYNN